MLNFDDLENLLMLLNYSELVLVITPQRYGNSPSHTFDHSLYRLPRQRGRAIRRWLVNHFQLTLSPPAVDGFSDATRLEGLMLRSLVGQARTLWDSVERRHELGVVGSMYYKERSKGEEDEEGEGEDENEDGEHEVEISADEVLEAIRCDLSSFPGFMEAWDKELGNPVPVSYRWPIPPKGSHYVMKERL